MVLALAMLQALGYCFDHDDVIWPPSGPVPPEPTFTVTALWEQPELSVRASDGARIPLRRTAAIDAHQWLFRPDRPLPVGPAELIGSIEAEWEVVEAPEAGPTWTARPVRAELSLADFFCPAGPFVVLDVPLAGERRLPMVEITAHLPAGPHTRRFALQDGAATLHDGCAPAFAFPAGDFAVALDLVGVDERERRTAPRRVLLVHDRP